MKEIRRKTMKIAKKYKLYEKYKKISIKNKL